MADSYCTTCGNYGLEDKDCPKCKRPPKTLGMTRMGEKNLKTLEDKIKQVEVPPNYVGVEWSEEVFWSLHPEFIDHKTKTRLSALTSCTDAMSIVHSTFADRKIPDKSFILILPPHMSKMVWIYSCIQHALKTGYTVAPVYDTLEVSGFLGAGSRNPYYRMYGKLTLEEYLMTDVLFITVTKTEFRKSAYEVIREVLDRRARMGRPTFITSQYGLEEISADEDTGYTLRLLDKGLRMENSLKVPVIRSFKDTNTEKNDRRYWNAKFNK